MRIISSDKSEVCFFGTWQKLRHADKLSSIKVAECCDDVCEKLKTLGVTLDSVLMFEDHITGMVCSCKFHIRLLRHIRHHLLRDVANMIACSIVGTRIDYFNSLFYGVSEKYLDKLQHLQNKLAQVVVNTSLRDYYSVDLLSELHWMSIWSRITFKVASLCRHALNDGQPTYLVSKLNPYRLTRSLRSSDLDLFQDPLRRTKSGARRSSCFAPGVWNSIPRSLREIQTTSVFKIQLKTYLFDTPPSQNSRK